MTDVETPVKTPEGKTDAADDKVIVAPDADQKKLQAAHDMAQAEARKANKLVADQTARIKELEAKAEGDKTDTDRLAALEVENARSKVALKHGLSMEDAEALTGTPADIQKAGEYWGKKLKAKEATDKKATDDANKAAIDKKVDDKAVDKGGDVRAAVHQTVKTGDVKPQPKQDGNLSWFELWSAATPAEQYKMEQAADASGEDITAGFKPKP